MATWVTLSVNVKESLHGAKAETRDLLLRQLSDILSAACEGEFDDNRIQVLDFGSERAQDGDANMITGHYEYLKELPSGIHHPAQIGAYYGFQWAIIKCDTLGLDIDIVEL